ncbi:MAG: hypothetical protein DWQ37_22335 [Planctomycetota bacterium]|nr:MAG: hypothetical protein DWQ37_22335 [Planctomycetota bacterium]
MRKATATELARQVLPVLKQDVADLADGWAGPEGTLQGCGKYQVDEGWEFAWIDAVVDHLLNGGESPLLGPAIWRLKDGGLAFDLETIETKVEFHPQGEPTSFTTHFLDKMVESHIMKGGPVRHVLQRYVCLEPNWFVAWYSVVDL